MCCKSKVINAIVEVIFDPKKRKNRVIYNGLFVRFPSKLRDVVGQKFLVSELILSNTASHWLSHGTIVPVDIKS